MKYFKLFLLSICLSCLFNTDSYTADINVSTKNKTSSQKNNNQNTKNQQIKRKIVRNTKKAQQKIKASTTKPSPSTNIYSISKKTINLNSPMCKYAKTNDVIALKKALLASNYDESEVNTICNFGESLLMIAVKNNNYLSAKFLIEKGADINLQNDAGVSPLHIIARLDTKEIDRIFDILISNKDLNLNIKDHEGYTPLMRAVDYEKVSMIEQLMKFKVDLNVKNNYGYNALGLAKKNLEGKKTEEEKIISKHIIDILDK